MKDQVIEFSSSTPKVIPSSGGVIGKVLIDLGEARDAFSAVVKGWIKYTHPDIPMVEVDGWAHPTWVTQSSVAVQIHPDKDSLDKAVCRVDDLIDCLSRTIGEKESPVLLAPITSHVHEIGNHFFNFVVKTRYSEGHDEG